MRGQLLELSLNRYTYNTSGHFGDRMRMLPLLGRDGNHAYELKPFLGATIKSAKNLTPARAVLPKFYSAGKATSVIQGFGIPVRPFW